MRASADENTEKAPEVGAFGAELEVDLDAEGGAAAAGRLHLWIVKLEPGCFKRLDVVHRASVQVHQRSGIHKNL